MSDYPYVVVFGDEVGIPMVLAALPDAVNVCCVIDPDRDAVKKIMNITARHIVREHPQNFEREIFIDNISRDVLPVLGIIASYGRILWPELLKIFSLGVVNIHGGKLPDYRGANVLQWAIINNEKEAGVSLHYVDEGIDTGDIIASSVVSIENNDTALEVRDKMTVEATLILKEWLPKLIVRKCVAQKQDEKKAQYWPRRKPSDGLFDWTWSNEKIYTLIRALVAPWPGAFFFDKKNEKVVLDRMMSFKKIEKLRQENNS